MSSPLTVPADLRVHRAHATLQSIAEVSGTHLLHIKVLATDPRLRDAGRRGRVDADVRIRPGHTSQFAAALRANGWTEVLPVRSGAVLDHSTDWYHPELGQADIHLRFPGIQIWPDEAFEVLRAGRGVVEIAHRACPAPSLSAQRLVLLLHAARTPQALAGGVERCWTQGRDPDAGPRVDADRAAGNGARGAGWLSGVGQAGDERRKSLARTPPGRQVTRFRTQMHQNRVLPTRSKNLASALDAALTWRPK